MHTYSSSYIIHASVIELLMKNLKPLSLSLSLCLIQLAYCNVVWRQQRRWWDRCGSDRRDLQRLSSSRTAKERDTIMLFWIHNETTEKHGIRFFGRSLASLSIVCHRFFSCILFSSSSPWMRFRVLPVNSNSKPWVCVVSARTRDGFSICHSPILRQWWKRKWEKAAGNLFTLNICSFVIVPQQLPLAVRKRKQRIYAFMALRRRRRRRALDGAPNFAETIRLLGGRPHEVSAQNYISWFMMLSSGTIRV